MIRTETLKRAALVAALCLAAQAGTAAERPAPGNARLGQAKALAERCLECHSPLAHDAERSSTTAARFPKLAGQAPAYIEKQLRDFRSGARRHEIMSVMAAGIAEADIADLAAYFGSLPAMHGDGAGDHPLARRLVLEGDATRGIPACASCHDPAGAAAATLPAPRIGGQERPYLEFQLRDWRSGDRANSPGGVMNRIAAELSEAEIEALARYLSGLSPPGRPAATQAPAGR